MHNTSGLQQDSNQKSCASALDQASGLNPNTSESPGEVEEYQNPKPNSDATPVCACVLFVGVYVCVYACVCVARTRMCMRTQMCLCRYKCIYKSVCVCVPLQIFFQ